MSISLSYESNFDERSSILGLTMNNSNEWRIAAEAVLNYRQPNRMGIKADGLFLYIY